MEDLFGHNRKKHMPLTAAIEEHIHYSADELNSYRGIKDMDFGIESEVAAISNSGFLTDRSNLGGTMKVFIPNPEGYLMETVYTAATDIQPIDISQVQQLGLLEEAQYVTLMAKLPENAANVTEQTLYNYGHMLSGLETLANTVLPEAIEIYRLLTTNDHPWEDLRSRFIDIELKMASLQDDIVKDHPITVSSFHGSMEPTNGKIYHANFDTLVKVLVADIIPMSFGLTRTVTLLMSQLNILVGEAIRINKEYHDTDVGHRPDYTLLKRFAQTIEKLPGTMENVVYVCRYVNQYLNVLVARNT
jgi:hypothetical protein